jgi:sulfur-carrier protein
MTTQILIAYPLRGLTGGLGKVEAEGRTLREIIDALESRFPGIRASILNWKGEVLPHLNIFLNEIDIQAREGLETAVQQGDEVAIIPAIAGGC